MAGLDKRVATYHEALEGLTNEMTILAAPPTGQVP